MNKYEKIKDLSEAEFRRLTGVKKGTFTYMLEVYETSLNKTKKLKGRPAALSTADQLLMMLEYNREYRTYFHIAQSYGLSESNAYRCIRRAEELLIRSGSFSLPGRKALQASEMSYEVVIVDATETKIERPKKSNAPTIQPKRSSTTSKPRS
jgi:phage anti-repressor protein